MEIASEAGRVSWFTSEEGGGPDVGITVGLGHGMILYFGDRTDREGGGQGFMVYDFGNVVASASMDDRDEIIELFQHHVAPALATSETEA